MVLAYLKAERKSCLIMCPLVKHHHQMSHVLRLREEEAGIKEIHKRKSLLKRGAGRKRARTQPAKDVAEALGIAAGVQSGWLGAAAAAAAPCTP